MIDVIYLNGGKGVRAGLGYPKQFARINGKPILVYGLETLRQLKDIGKIFIPTANGNLIKTTALLNEYHVTNFHLVEAGETRQLSVRNALEHVTTERVLICEAVRPMMNKLLVQKVIDINSECVIPFDRSIATVVDVHGNCYDREKIGMVQMPQKYNTQKLLDISQYMIDIGNYNASDDFSLYQEYLKVKKNEAIMFEDVYMFHGYHENIKITYPIDLKIAEVMLGVHDDE